MTRLRRRLRWLAEALAVNLREPVPLAPVLPMPMLTQGRPPLAALPLPTNQERPMATRNPRTGQVPVVDPRDPFEDPTIGDVHDTTENPVLDLPTVGEVIRVEADVPALDVTINTRVARDPGGARCIRIDIPKFLTAAEAHELVLSLQPAIEAVGSIRQNLGFES